MYNDRPVLSLIYWNKYDESLDVPLALEYSAGNGDTNLDVIQRIVNVNYGHHIDL